MRWSLLACRPSWPGCLAKAGERRRDGGRTADVDGKKI